MIGLEVLFRICEDKQHEFRQAVRSLLSSELDEGCLLQHIYEDVDEPGSFVWLEHWSEEAPFHRRLGSDRHRTLRGAINVLGSIQTTRVSEMREQAPDACVEGVQ